MSRLRLLLLILASIVYWMTMENISASKKETLIPESVPTECDLTINDKSTLGNDVAAYVYKETNKPAGEWPGKTMTAAEGHKGWYTMHLTLDNSTDYSLILNDDGHGNQLKDVTLSTKGRSRVLV